jgi:hypothetical protein
MTPILLLVNRIAAHIEAMPEPPSIALARDRLMGILVPALPRLRRGIGRVGLSFDQLAGALPIPLRPVLRLAL